MLGVHGHYRATPALTRNLGTQGFFLSTALYILPLWQVSGTETRQTRIPTIQKVRLKEIRTVMLKYVFKKNLIILMVLLVLFFFHYIPPSLDHIFIHHSSLWSQGHCPCFVIRGDKTGTSDVTIKTEVPCHGWYGTIKIWYLFLNRTINIILSNNQYSSHKIKGRQHNII